MTINKSLTVVKDERCRGGKAVLFGELEPAFEKVKNAADEILAMNQDAMVRKSNDVRRTAERMITSRLGPSWCSGPWSCSFGDAHAAVVASSPS